jgi:hypothetical protein
VKTNVDKRSLLEAMEVIGTNFLCGGRSINR